MNSSFVLMTDSSTDLPHDYYVKNDVAFIPINYTLDGTEYKDDAGVSMSYADFYTKIRGGAMSTTSMINRQDYITEFESYLKDGKDVLYIAISSGISGSYDSAMSAAAEISPSYPDRKLYVCDGLMASMGGAVLVTYAMRQRAAGKTIDEVRDWVEANKRNIVHLFTVDDLMFLRRGGRVSSTAAVLGSLIGVKPMLDVDADGKLRACHKKRGRKGALDGLVEWMGTLTESNTLEIFAISHGDCKEEADYVLGKVKEKYKIAELLQNPIGPVVGSHSGPGTIAIFFMGKTRV